MLNTQHHCQNQETGRDRILVVRTEDNTASIGELPQSGEEVVFSDPIPLDNATCNWCGKGLTPEAVSKLASQLS
jgi:hypothetical protein